MKHSELKQLIKEEIQKEIRNNKRFPKLKSNTPEDIADDLKVYFQIAYETGLETPGSYDDFEKEFWDGERGSIIDKIKNRFHKSIRVV